MIKLDLSGLNMDPEIERIKAVTRNGMRRAGEKYVEVSRENGSYQNHTGNLRNSNGYGIAENGVFTEMYGDESFKAGAGKNLEADMVLECGAGRDYASYVQRKGYDVTDSGQLAAENELRRLFK